MKKIFKIAAYIIGLWIFAILAKDNIYILVFGVAVLFWLTLNQMERSLNENLTKHQMYIESLESRVKDLEELNEINNDEIQILVNKNHELSDRLFEIEKYFKGVE